ALGCARSRRGHGIAGRNRACLQGHLPDAQSTHRHLHGVAVALARPTEPAKEARRDWPHGGRGREGGRADVKTTLSQRLGAETLGTAFLVAAVVGSGIMAAKLAGGNAALALLCNTLATGAPKPSELCRVSGRNGGQFRVRTSIERMQTQVGVV